MKKLLAKYVVSSTLMIILLVILVLDFIGLGKHPFIIIFISFLIGLYALSCNPSFKNGNKAERRNYFEGFIIGSVLLFGFGLTRQYELVTEFRKPCWSPDGKQVAFFMERRLTKYHPGLLGDIPNIQWDKYYLCTMDYNGNNFKQIKQMNSSGYVRWSGSGNIVFTQGSDINNKPEAKMYKINPYGTGLEELWKWDEKTEYHGVLWLSPQEDYFMLYKSTGTTQVYAIYDRKKKEIKKTLSYSDINLDWYGSYKKNEIALIVRQIDPKITERVLVKYNIDADKVEQQKIIDKSYFRELDGFEYTTLAPDRSMYADIGALDAWHANAVFVRKTNNDILGKIYYKTKRSYLFNIFGK